MIDEVVMAYGGVVVFGDGGGSQWGAFISPLSPHQVIYSGMCSPVSAFPLINPQAEPAEQSPVSPETSEVMRPISVGTVPVSLAVPRAG